MPDDQNVPVGGAGQTHSARVQFASDTVRETVGELLAKAGGNLTPVDAEERQRVAWRLRKARAAAPLNLLPLLTLLLAACGQHTPDLVAPDGSGAEGDAGRSEDDAADNVAGDAKGVVIGAGQLVKTSVRVTRPEKTPEVQENLVRMCLKAIADNTLQPSAIHELCSLIDLDAVDRSHDVIWRWTAPPRTEGYSTNKVCYLVNAQDLLFWMFMESPAAATGYAGRLRPKSVPEIPGDAQGDGITDASLVAVVAAVPEAAAAAGGGFGGGLAALPLLALGGGGGGGGGGGPSAGAAALAAPPPSAGQIGAPPEQAPVEEPEEPPPLQDPPPVVEDIVDERLVLVRDPGFGAGTGSSGVQEGAGIETVLYKVRNPVPDVDGNGIYLYLSGPDAARFDISADGELTFIASPDHERPGDSGGDNIYEVTIHAREVAAGRGGAGISAQAPAKAGPQVADAAHRVTVTVQDINDTPPTFNPAEVTEGITEDVELGIDGDQQEGTTIYQASATPDVAGDRVEYSLEESGNHDLLDIDPTTGKVWFISRPAERDYSFTVIARVGGQSAQQTVNLSVAEGAPEPFGQGDDPAEADQITILVVSGRPVAGARIFVDADEDGILDADEKTGAPIGVTDSNGRAVIEVSQDGARYIADVSHLPGHQGMAWAIYYGQFGGDLVPQGVHVISPLTHLLAANTAIRRAEWRAGPDRDENSRAFEEQIIADNRNILMNFFRRMDPALTEAQLEQMDVLHILDPATYGIRQAEAARAEVEERGPDEAPRRVRRQALEEPPEPHLPEQQPQEQQPPSPLAAAIEATIRQIATNAALIDDDPTDETTAAEVAQAIAGLLDSLRAELSNEVSQQPDAVVPLAVPPEPAPREPPAGKIKPDIQRFVPTDPQEDETADLGLKIRPRSPTDTTEVTLRHPVFVLGYQENPARDEPPGPARPDALDDKDNPLYRFVSAESYFVKGKYGYLQVQWRADDPGNGDGPGAWFYAYFTPAHVGYDPLQLGQDVDAVERAFADIPKYDPADPDSLKRDVFTFTVTDRRTATNPDGNSREIHVSLDVRGVNDDPALTGQIPEQSTDEDVAKPLDEAWFRLLFTDVDDDPDNSGDSFAGVIITSVSGGTLRHTDDLDMPVVPGQGGLRIAAGDLDNYVFRPDNDFEGAARITFRLVDRHGAESADTGTMTITVTAAPDPSTAAPANTPRGGDLPGNAADPDNPVGGTFIPSDPDRDDDKTNIAVKIHSRTRREDDVDGQPGPDGEAGAPDVTLLDDPEQHMDGTPVAPSRPDPASDAEGAHPAAFVIVGKYGYLRAHWDATLNDPAMPGRDGGYRYVYFVAKADAAPAGLTAQQQAALDRAKETYRDLAQYDSDLGEVHEDNGQAIGTDVFVISLTDAATAAARATNAEDPAGRNQTVELTFLALGVNDAPQAAETHRTVDEGSDITLVADDFGFQDDDAGDRLKAVRLTDIGDARVLLDDVQTDRREFTRAELDAGQVKLTRDADVAADRAGGPPDLVIRFRVQDQHDAWSDENAAGSWTISFADLNNLPPVFVDAVPADEDARAVNPGGTVTVDEGVAAAHHLFTARAMPEQIAGDGPQPVMSYELQAADGGAFLFGDVLTIDADDGEVRLARLLKFTDLEALATSNLVGFVMAGDNSHVTLAFSVLATAEHASVSATERHAFTLRINNLDSPPAFDATSLEFGAVPGDPANMEVTASIGGTRSFQLTGSDQDGDAVGFRLAAEAASNDNERVTINDQGQIVFRTGMFDFEEARVGTFEVDGRQVERRYFLIQAEAVSTGFSGAEQTSGVQDIRIFIEDDLILPPLSVSVDKNEVGNRGGVFTYGLNIRSFTPPAPHDGTQDLVLYAVQPGQTDAIVIGRLVHEAYDGPQAEIFGSYRFSFNSPAGGGGAIQLHYGELQKELGLSGSRPVFSPFEGIGSPFDRLKDGEVHRITWQIYAEDSYGRRSPTQTVHLDLEGKSDRPQFVTYGTPFRRPGEELTPDDPDTPQNERTVRTEQWSWWDESGIWNWFETLSDASGRVLLDKESLTKNAVERAEDAEIAAGAQTAWRFMAIDLDGSYFDAARFDDRIDSTRLRKGYMRAEGQSDEDYARVLEKFIANMIVIDHRFTIWPHQLVGVGDAAHKSKFEIVAARDSNGELITVSYPGSWQNQSTGNGLKIPVFELRLRAGQTLDIGTDYVVVIRLHDAPPTRSPYKFAERVVKITQAPVRPPTLDAVADADIDENSATGSVVVTLAGQTGEGVPLSYELVGGSDLFEILPGENTVKVKRGVTLDFDSLTAGQRISTLQARAVITKIGQTLKSPVQSFTVTIRNLDDNAPVFEANAGDHDQDSGSVGFDGSFHATGVAEQPEHNAPKTFVVRAVDADGDEVRYHLVDHDGSPDDNIIDKAVANGRVLNHNHLVSVDPATGVITFNPGVFDHEYGTRRDPRSKMLLQDDDRLFTDGAGKRYFLIELVARSQSTLGGEQSVKETAVQPLRIYVSNLNDEPVAFSNTGMDKVTIDNVETDRITLTVGENNAALGTLTAASIEAGVNTVMTFTTIGPLPYGIRLDEATGALTLADGFDYDTLPQDHRDNGITFMVQAILTITTVNAEGEAVRTPKSTAPTQVRLVVTDVDEPVMFNQAPAPVRQPVGDPVTPPAVTPTTQQNPDGRPRLELPDPQPGAAAQIAVDVPENQQMVGWFTISDSDASRDPAQLPTLSLAGDHAELFEAAYLSDGATRLVVLRFKQNPDYEKGFVQTKDQTGWQYGDGTHAGAYRVNLVLNAGSSVHQQQVIPVLVIVTDQDSHGPEFVETKLAPAREVTATTNGEHEFAVKAVDADGDAVSYALVPNKAGNDNHRIARGGPALLQVNEDGAAILRFKPGAFDYEAARIDPVTGERYFLIEVRARSTHPMEERKKTVGTFRVPVEDDGVLPALTVTSRTTVPNVGQPVYLINIKTFADEALHDGSTSLDIFLRPASGDPIRVATATEKEELLLSGEWQRNFDITFLNDQFPFPEGEIARRDNGFIFRPMEELGSGAPLNLLKEGESRSVELTFFTRDRQGRESSDQIITFDLQGRENRPVLVEFGTSRRQAEDSGRPWDWWHLDGVWHHERYLPVVKNDPEILQDFGRVDFSESFQRVLNFAKAVTVPDFDERVWLFMVVDEDGRFLSGPDSYLRETGESDSDYISRLNAFIKEKMSLHNEVKDWEEKKVPFEVPDHSNMFEVVVARDKDNRPLTTPWPLDPDLRIPVFELRLRDPDQPGFAYTQPLMVSLRVQDAAGSRPILNSFIERVFLVRVEDDNNDVAPTGGDKAKSGVMEDVATFFQASDFTGGARANDVGQTITHVVIAALPEPRNGSLELNGVAVRLNQEIPVGDIDGLTYKSAPDSHGEGHGNFKFRLKDDGEDNRNLSPEYTMQVDVAPVNDAPTVTEHDISYSIDEGADFVLVESRFTPYFADVDSGDTLDAVIITGIAGGTLRRVAHPDDEIALDQDGYRIDVGRLDDYVIRPDASFSASFSGRVIVTFKIEDSNGGISADTGAMTIDVRAHAPEFIGVQPSQLAVDENRAPETVVRNGDFDARIPGAGGKDGAGGVTYRLAGKTGRSGEAAPGYLTDAEVNRYFSIDAEGRLKVKGTLPDQDAVDGDSRLRQPVKFIVEAANKHAPARKVTHEVTLTIRNVPDEPPTAPKGLKVFANDPQAFLDGVSNRMNIHETHPSIADNYDEGTAYDFRINPLREHAHINMDGYGRIAVKGNPPAGRHLSAGWQWKYFDLPDSEWVDGGEDIVIHVLPPPVPAQRSNGLNFALDGRNGYAPESRAPRVATSDDALPGAQPSGLGLRCGMEPSRLIRIRLPAWLAGSCAFSRSPRSPRLA